MVTILIEIIGWFLAVYILLAFIMGALAIITNYKNLKKLKNLEIVLFFILQPILSIKEVFNGKAKYED